MTKPDALTPAQQALIEHPDLRAYWPMGQNALASGWPILGASFSLACIDEATGLPAGTIGYPPGGAYIGPPQDADDDGA